LRQRSAAIVCEAVSLATRRMPLLRRRAQFCSVRVVVSRPGDAVAHAAPRITRLDQTDDQQEEGKMELTSDIQYLRRRRDELERRMRQPGGVRIIEERELLQIRQRLQDMPRQPERGAELAGIR